MVVAESRGNSNNLLQPIVSALNQNQSKNAKPILVDRLSSKCWPHSLDLNNSPICVNFFSVDLVERVDKQAILIRVVKPLVQPTHKLANESNGNVALKQALQRLAVILQSALVGIYVDEIGLKQQYWEERN